jgi:pimeloyl-ACP methyl ester carboxylesterase
MASEHLHVVRHHQDAPGPPIVLVHGAPDRSKNFAHVVHRLSDLPVTVYDRRGYGSSLAAAVADDGSVLGGFEVHAADLIDLLDGTPSIVVAQSAGGTISMLAATLAPELFLALGAWEPPMVPYDWWVGEEARNRTMAWTYYEDTRQLGEDMNRSILGDARWEQLRDSTKEMLREEGLAFRADMACQALPLFDVDALKVPFVVGYGNASPPAFAAAFERLAALAGADVFVGDGADHFAHLGAPEVWAKFVRHTIMLAAGSSR